MAELKTDRRSQRTQRILHEASMSLIQEKRYEDITVQDIIDRADVGRSTFYAHFQDKDDLMVYGFMHLMEYLTEAVSQPDGESQRLLPTRELLEHVQESQHLMRSMINGRGFELFMEKGQEYWSRKIAADLQVRLPAGQQPAVPIAVMAQFATGTLMTMLRWWLDKKMPYSPQEMDHMLEMLIMPGIQQGLGIDQ
jgi:AcrR family transcriptional regulator